VKSEPEKNIILKIEKIKLNLFFSDFVMKIVAQRRIQCVMMDDAK